MTATSRAPARIRPLQNLRHIYDEAMGDRRRPSVETVITVVVVAAAVLFGLAHPNDLSAAGVALVMISLAALAAVLAVLVVRTGRLAPAIVAHAAFNAINLAVASLS